MATKSKKIEPQQITDLAFATRNWALQIGAAIDSKTGRHGYFTINEWIERFRDTHEANKGVWKQVKRRLLELGEPLARDQHGHYWGEQGDQAKDIDQLIKSMVALGNTTKVRLEAMGHSSRWEEIKPGCQEVLSAFSVELNRPLLGELVARLGLALPAPKAEQMPVSIAQ